MSFIYQIIKSEFENYIELSVFSVNSKFETKIDKKLVNYQILCKKEDFENLNIKSDKIILAKKDFLTKKGEKVVKIEIKSKELHEYIRSELRENKFEVFEADFPIEHSYLIDNNIKISQNSKYFPLKYLSIDIETIGRTTKEQEIISISTYSNTCLKQSKVYVNLDKLSEKKQLEVKKSNNNSKNKKNTEEKDYKTILCLNEREMLEKFRDDIIEFSPQAIIGWNLIDFDFKVIRDRMKALDLRFTFSKFEEKESKLRIVNDFFRDSTMVVCGVLVFDIISLLKTNFIIFKDYKLDTVANCVLGDNKIKVSDENSESLGFEDKLDAITKLFEKNPLKLIEYNFKDSLLVSQIVEKLKIVELMCKRSTLTNTPISKVKSPIASLDLMYLEELHKRGFVANSNFNYSESTPIEGAYVVEPKRGFYKDIFVFDFKSLYPSVIMTFNIDPFSYGENGQIVAPNGAKFDRESGILPQLILKLYKERDIAKADKDEVKSYALKTTMNSFYGAMASPKSRFYNKEVGGAITSFAREIIKKAKKYAEGLGNVVTYGDSVTKDTKIWIREIKTKKISKINICELFDFKGIVKEKKLEDGSIKYYKNFKNLETLTMNDSFENIWKPIEYVVKHKTSKKIFKLHINNQNSICVTQDHSLIGYDFYKGLIMVKPENSSKIIFNYGFETDKIKKKDEFFAKFLGFWIGDGYLENNGYNIGISTGLDMKEFIEKVINNISLLDNTKIYHKKKGDINFSKKELVNDMLDLGFKVNWTSKTKRIPEKIFDKNFDFICSFLSGLFSSDGTILTRSNLNIIRYTSINLDLIKDIQKLLFLVGIGSSYFKENTQNSYLGKKNGTYSYHLVVCNKKHEFFMKNIGFIFDRKNEKYIFKENRKKIISKHIKSKEIVEYDDFVYDICVNSTHRFYGNNILLKNTDSIFVEIKGLENKSLDDKRNIGLDFEKKINDYFDLWVKNEFSQRSFLTIENEKMYSDFFIASKKRYVGFDEFTGKLGFVGMEAIRGDWTDLAKNFQIELVKMIFANNKVDEIKKFILDYVKKLENGEFDSDLVYTKKITKPLAMYTKMTPPHVRAAREVENFSGRIVKYVLTKDGPKHISKMGLPVNYDYKHYIEKQLKGVSDDLLECLGLDFDDIVQSKSQKSLNRFF